MSEKRLLKLQELATSLKPEVQRILDEAIAAKSDICVIGISTIQCKEAKIILSSLRKLSEDPNAKINANFIPLKMLNEDSRWRELRDLLED